VPRKVGESLLWCAADRAWSSRRLGHGMARDEKGGDLFIGDKCACLRPKELTATSRSKSRPRQECTAGETLDRPAVRPVPVRPRGVRRGRTSRRPRDVRGFGERASGRASSLGAWVGGPDAKEACARGRGAGARGAVRRRSLPVIVWTGPVRAIKTQFFATKVH
jgi:hypothetical protein